MYDTTRRYPRTLQEAFGPYASGSDIQQDRTLGDDDLIAICAGLIALLGIATMVVVSIWTSGGAA